jgi:maltokinase
MTPSSAQLTELLAPWVPHQRWFGGKGRDVTRLEAHASDPIGAPSADAPASILPVFVDVEYADGDLDRYQVPLSVRAQPWEDLAHAYLGELEGEHLYDAPHDPDAANVLLDAIRGEAAAGDVTFHRITEFTDHLRSRLVGAEQSNTSIVYGEELILKVFRRVAPGLNPDLELTRTLQDAGSTHVAPVRGWIERDTEPEATTLAVLQEFVPSASEGWALAQASVRDLFAEADLHADEVGGDFAAESHRLGAATAEVHALLAQALPTASAGADAVQSATALMHQRLDRATGEVPELMAFAPLLHAAYDGLASVLEDGEAPLLQRIHGDFHLGQVLRTDHGWLILDFEGEPARPLAERRALASPLRDVAGMLRSYEYAARSQLADHLSGNPGLEYRAGEWADRNRGAFCDGYAEVAGRDPRDDMTLLRAFELDKAVYEVVYEARHRPTWLNIPLGSIARLAT